MSQLALRPLERLSHRQRAATPLAFATYLVDQVRLRYGTITVAALWVARDSVYKGIPGVECWDEDRDASLYEGPWPVICHPPCGPWGKYRHVSRQERLDGEIAIDMWRRYGGVIEQPVGSSLFGVGELVNQSDFGHLALKPTKLLWS